MFLPTKAHIKEIAENQKTIRLGNRVPKDAVNLAYSHVPALNSQENISITDLSNTILENTQNDRSEDLYMYPNNALLLQTDDGRYELGTEDALITNVFSDDGIPLYYSYQLAYRHYDNKGPDPYGIYHREGITLIDHKGRPVDRPYQIQLIPDHQHLNLYYVIIYTSFHDQESDHYRVLYNAIDIQEDGRMETIPGYREPLTLTRAFRRTEQIGELVDLVKKKEIFPIYYQANGEQTSYTKLYVPTPQIEDHRIYEKFRYQVGVEVTTPTDRLIFTTPWYSSEVINPIYLNPDELKNYTNGFKKVTDKTAEAIMRGFVPFKYFQDEKVILRYFANINNPRVTEILRVDGSSELFVTTHAEYPNNDLFIPKNARLNRIPLPRQNSIRFKIRPLRAAEEETLYMTFVVDTSASMGINDPEKVLRMKMMESLLYSARQYYKQNWVNGYFFNHLTREIREEFVVGNEDIIDLYKNHTMIDSDVTNPIPAIDQAVETIRKIDSTYITDQGSLEEREWINRRVVVLITDGEFGDFEELDQRIESAKKENILITIITHHNYDIISPICIKHGVLCIDATSPRLAMELRYFFFHLAGLNESIQIGPIHSFSMTPDDNDLSLYHIDANTFPILKEYTPDPLVMYPKSTYETDPLRFGLEVEFDPYNQMPELSIYIKDKVANIIEPTINGSYIMTFDALRKDRQFQVFAHSEAYDYSFSPTYSIRYNDQRRIQILPPRESDAKKSWFVRVRNGRFDRSFKDREGQPTYMYAIPEYYRQSFLPIGHPYRQIIGERPTVLNQSQLKLSHRPLYIHYNGKEVTNLSILVNGHPLRVKSWIASDGIIEIDGAVTVNDEIYVDYQYDEDSYTYRGYYDKETDRFWQLDLNPSSGHYITIRDPSDGEIKDVPSFVLINRTVYLYLRPCAKINRDARGNMRPPSELQAYSLFHTFEKVSDKNAVLLGEIRVRPNSNQGNIQLIDTRTRGGGLKETITHQKMKEYEMDSFYYWDIGHWDGEPFPENGVIAVRVSQHVLREHGGIFTKAEIENKLDKYLGYGILPIIEYVDDPESLLQVPENLVVEVIDIDEAGELIIKQPTFSLSLEDNDGK